MNKKTTSIFLVLCCLTLTSCYNTKILHGAVTPKDPVTEVNKKWNHHLLWGLVPLDNATMQAADFIGNRNNYVVKTNQTFVNGLVNCLTFGIYSPTTTTYYIPLSDVNSSNK